jgi:hypothetical protein
MDEKMLEKLTTHDIQDVMELFNLADKCVRATKGHAWHTPLAPEVRKGAKPIASTATQGGGSKKKKKKKKKKVRGKNQPLARAPTASVTAAAAGGGRGPRGDKHHHQASGSDDRGACCPMHNSTRHIIEECREIKKLTE